MLSRAELNYEGENKPTYHYSVVLKGRIEDKLESLHDELSLLVNDPKFKGYLNPEDKELLREWAGKFKSTSMLVCKKGGRWRLDVLDYQKNAGSQAMSSKPQEPIVKPSRSQAKSCRAAYQGVGRDAAE